MFNYFMFANCYALKNVDVSSFDTSSVGDMNSIFYNCSSLTSLDIKNFNTSNVTSFSNAFYGLSSVHLLILVD